MKQNQKVYAMKILSKFEMVREREKGGREEGKEGREGEEGGRRRWRKGRRGGKERRREGGGDGGREGAHHSFVIPLQIRRSDSAFFWEERDIMAHAGSDWIVKVCVCVCVECTMQ